MIELGMTGKDKITGFTGVVVGRVVYISGCNQLLLSPKVNAAGEFKSSEWFDEQRVDEVKGKAKVVLDNGLTPGPDRPAPRR